MPEPRRALSLLAVLLCLSGETSVAAQQPARNPHLPALEQRIAGLEGRPAEEVFRNIQIFKGVPAGRVLRIMEFASVADLNVDCGHCHVEGDWASDQKPTKGIARRMWQIRAAAEQDVRRATGNEEAVVTSFTCHRGRAKPSLDR